MVMSIRRKKRLRESFFFFFFFCLAITRARSENIKDKVIKSFYWLWNLNQNLPFLGTAYLPPVPHTTLPFQRHFSSITTIHPFFVTACPIQGYRGSRACPAGYGGNPGNNPGWGAKLSQGTHTHMPFTHPCTPKPENQEETPCQHGEKMQTWQNPGRDSTPGPRSVRQQF